jgi:hypothetical protein
MLILIPVLALAAPAPASPAFAPVFAPAVRIEAAGKPIDVTTGHAAPCVYDFNGDGVRDLLVGEFGSGRFTGPVHTQGSGSHSWSKGRLRIYLNTGTDESPKFADWSYLQAARE